MAPVFAPIAGGIFNAGDVGAAAIAGAVVCFKASNVRLVSMLPFRIRTMFLTISIASTSMAPSRSPSRRIGFLVFGCLPGSFSATSSSARGGPRILRIPVSTTLVGGGGGGRASTGFSSTGGGGLIAKTLRSTIDWKGLPGGFSSSGVTAKDGTLAASEATRAATRKEQRFTITSISILRPNSKHF